MQPIAQFDSLILPHLDAAYTLARYLLQDEHDAQDAVQDAALRAYRHFASFRGGDARAWFLAIVRNSSLTWRRRRWRRETISLSDDENAPPVEPRAADSRAIEQSERAAIQRAVEALPLEFREVIVLREIQDLSYAEISEVAGVPIGTVMSRLSRARERLAKALGHLVQEAG